MFISSYNIAYFFVKNFFSECLYCSEYGNRMSDLFFWLRNRPSIDNVHNWRNGGGRGERGFIQNVCRCVLGEGVEKSLIRYVRTKWMAPNKCCGIFFVHWFSQVR